MQPYTLRFQGIYALRMFSDYDVRLLFTEPDGSTPLDLRPFDPTLGGGGLKSVVRPSPESTTYAEATITIATDQGPNNDAQDGAVDYHLDGEDLTLAFPLQNHVDVFGILASGGPVFIAGGPADLYPSVTDTPILTA